MFTNLDEATRFNPLRRPRRKAVVLEPIHPSMRRRYGLVVYQRGRPPIVDQRNLDYQREVQARLHQPVDTFRASLKALLESAP